MAAQYTAAPLRPAAVVCPFRLPMPPSSFTAPTAVQTQKNKKDRFSSLRAATENVRQHAARYVGRPGIFRSVESITRAALLSGCRLIFAGDRDAANSTICCARKRQRLPRLPARTAKWCRRPPLGATQTAVLLSLPRTAEIHTPPRR